jgi:iron complex outermembrane receptor protein
MRYKMLVVALASLLATTSHAQDRNSISGITTDGSKSKPLPGVTIFIPDLGRSTHSDRDGHFVLHDLPAGNYLLEFSHVGFQSVTREASTGSASVMDVTLTISSYVLDPVTVTGVSTATERKNNPIPVATMSHSQLREGATTNIIDAISNIPGVSQITVGPSISKPVIRGLGYNRVVVMNDGVRQEGQQWFDEFGIEIDEHSVDRVEVLKGPGSLRYGSDAMAGVINFLAPRALADGQMKGRLSGEYQTNNGKWDGAAEFMGNQKGFTWDILYSGLTTHDYKNKYDGYVWNSSYGQQNLKGIFGIDRKWGHSRLTLSMFNQKLGIIEGLRDSATGSFLTHYQDGAGDDSLDIAPADQYKKYGFYPIIHQHIRHYKVVSDNSFTLGKGRLDVRLGLQVNHRQEANDISKGDIYNNYFFLRTINYDVQYVLPSVNKWDISFGVNGMQQSSEDRGIVFVLPEYDLFDAGIFAIAKRDFGKLHFSGGLRLDTRTLHGHDMWVDADGVRLPGPTAGAEQRFTAYHSDFTGLSGSLGATYDISNAFYVKANLARGYRAPTAAETGQNGIHDGTPFYEIGDPDLKPEYSLQVDGTIGFHNQDLTAELNLFNNHINNYVFPVKLESALGGDSIRYDNVAGFDGPTFKYVQGDANLSGAEIMLNLHPRSLTWGSLDLAYSFVHAIQLNQPLETKYLPYTPPAKLHAGIRIAPASGSGTFRTPYFSLGIDHYFEQDKIYFQFGNETVTPGYTLINASLGTDIFAGAHHICSLVLAGTNLADVAYQSNMSRLKYTDTNNVTGRVGIYNMGRNLSFKVIFPFDFGH